MRTIKCNNSASISVKFILNGGRKDEILVFALQDGDFWFAVGNGRLYKTVSGAKKAAIKELGDFGYTFNQKEMADFKIA